MLQDPLNFASFLQVEITCKPETMHFYAFSILLTSLQLVRAYPQTPENQQNECSLTWQPRDHDRPPLYGVEQKMIGLCQPLSVSCSKGLTLPVPQTECPNGKVAF